MEAILLEQGCIKSLSTPSTISLLLQCVIQVISHGSMSHTQSRSFFRLRAAKCLDGLSFSRCHQLLPPRPSLDILVSIPPQIASPRTHLHISRNPFKNLLNSFIRGKEKAIISSLGNADLRGAETDPQYQSPLFSIVPAETWNEIFRLALQECEDSEKNYERETVYTRPGFGAQKRIDVALLRFCKRVYAEMRVVPLRDLELCFYRGERTRVPDRIIPSSFLLVMLHSL